MTTFESTVTSQADVAATRAAIWKLLTDPEAITRLTPLLTRIDAKGDSWVWHLAKVGGLGVDVKPVFTEAMEFDELTSIVFSHRPPKGSSERFGVDGRYDLADAGKGSHLAISLTVKADLPLPKVAGPAVRQVMRQTMGMMGARFSRNLLAELKA